MESPSIAVIVPLGAVEPPLTALFFERVRKASGRVSLVAAADSRTSSETREAFARAGASVFAFEDIPRGARLTRAAQLHASSAEAFVFLHADTVLPVGWELAVRAALARGAVGGAFRLGFSSGGWRMSWVSGWANLRNRFTRMPYGDQAPFVRQDVYERIGGHRPWPILEDWDFSRRLRAEGRIALLSLAVETSPRRYLERGVARTVLKNWEILSMARRGESPVELAERYRT